MSDFIDTLLLGCFASGIFLTVQGYLFHKDWKEKVAANKLIRQLGIALIFASGVPIIFDRAFTILEKSIK